MSTRRKKLAFKNTHILGVSAGNGVILYPFKESLIGNIECRSDYYIDGKPLQWNLNFDVPMYKSLEEADFKCPVDVIIGHPKCGYSSMFALSRGKKFSSHKDEPSLTLFINAINKYRPKVFLMENLPKILNTYPKEDFQAFFSEYHLFFWEGPVTFFGNSQTHRNRLLIIGLHSRAYTPGIFKRLTKIKPRPIDPFPVKILLKNLPNNGHITEPLNSIITMYSGFKISLLGAKDFWKTHPNLRHWPANGKMNTAPGVYINRDEDFPLTVRKTNRQFNSSGEQMSPRELARIQGVPDSFFLYHNLENLTLSINKGRITVANTPPVQIGNWFFYRLRKAGIL